MNPDINVIINIFVAIIGLGSGAMIVAYRILHTLQVIQEALADGSMSDDDLRKILDELLSYRKLLRL